MLVLAFFAVLPSFLKRPFYRWFFGYKIGKRVSIGVSIIDAGECSIADDVTIGHFNVVTRVQKLVIKDHVRIGHLNIIRGGAEVSLGRYCEILRMNEINSIPEPEVVNEIDPVFLLGDGSIVTTGHKIDFTDRVEIGRRPRQGMQRVEQLTCGCRQSRAGHGSVPPVAATDCCRRADARSAWTS